METNIICDRPDNNSYLVFLQAAEYILLAQSLLSHRLTQYTGNDRSCKSFNVLKFCSDADQLY